MIVLWKKMPLPTLNPTQVEWAVQQVAAYIQNQRHTYQPGVAPLSLNQKNAMRSFFPQSALDSVRLVVLTEQRVNLATTTATVTTRYH